MVQFEKSQSALKFREIVAINLNSMPYIILFQFVMLCGNGPKIIVRAPLWILRKIWVAEKSWNFNIVYSQLGNLGLYRLDSKTLSESSTLDVSLQKMHYYLFCDLFICIQTLSFIIQQCFTFQQIDYNNSPHLTRKCTNFRKNCIFGPKIMKFRHFVGSSKSECASKRHVVTA